MENLLCDEKILELYNERFHHEFINANFKGNEGTLLLPGHDKTAVNNTVHLLTLYSTYSDITPLKEQHIKFP